MLVLLYWAIVQNTNREDESSMTFEIISIVVIDNVSLWVYYNIRHAQKFFTEERIVWLFKKLIEFIW